MTFIFAPDARNSFLVREVSKWHMVQQSALACAAVGVSQRYSAYHYVLRDIAWHAQYAAQAPMASQLKRLFQNGIS